MRHSIYPINWRCSKVIKHDLQLLAQISSSSEENYFKAFMINLLELFSTDRRLLETRGSLIIRQLCLNLNTEKIYRTFAEILEKEDVSDSTLDYGRLFRSLTGSRICKCHCSEVKHHPHHIARTCGFSETAEKPRNSGPSRLCTSFDSS